jgi:C4-dicarboxylate transporter
MYLVIWDFQASSRARRSLGDRPAHQAAAWCARSTAASISYSPQTGNVAITSDVAGLSVSNVVADLAGPCVQVVVVAIALTVVSPANSGRKCQVNHRPWRGR